MNNHTLLITTAILTPTGLQRPTYEAESLNDAARHEPAGVYTVARTYNHVYCLKLAAHLDRLEQSARLTGITPALDRARLRTALRQLLQESGNPESRFRLTIPAAQPDHCYIAIEPLQAVPRHVREHGVHVVTFDIQRQNPVAKSTHWMDARAPLKAQLKGSDYEGLLVGADGSLLEGLGSNFYAIMNGTLYTAGSGVLHGISRSIVMTVAPDILPVEEHPVTRADLPVLAEAFLTSSSRGVVPIVQIDQTQVSDGQPGPFTRTIEKAYDAWAQNHLESI